MENKVISIKKPYQLDLFEEAENFFRKDLADIELSMKSMMNLELWSAESLAIYSKLKVDKSDLLKSWSLPVTRVELTRNEKIAATEKLDLRKNEITNIINEYELKPEFEYGVYSLDKKDIEELEGLRSSIESQILRLRTSIKFSYSRKIKVVLDQEESLHEHSISTGTSKRNVSEASGEVNTDLILKNSSYKRKEAINRAYFRMKESRRRVILDLAGEPLVKATSIAAVLMKNSYFLEQENGLMPFNSLKDVEDYLLSVEESEWVKILKFTVPHGNIHYEDYASAVPIIHEN